MGRSWTCGREVARGIQDDRQGPVDEANKNDAVSLQTWVNSVILTLKRPGIYESFYSTVKASDCNDYNPYYRQ